MQAAMKKNNHNIFHAARLLCVGGLVIGPATGHAYARQYDRCFWGTLARGASLTLINIPFLINIHLSDQLGPAAVPIAALSAFGLLFSAFYDIGTAGRSVDKFKRKYGFAGLHIVPTYSASHRAPGLMLTLSY
jgi:hypothetical protein